MLLHHTIKLKICLKCLKITIYFKIQIINIGYWFLWEQKIIFNIRLFINKQELSSFLKILLKDKWLLRIKPFNVVEKYQYNFLKVSDKQNYT